MVSNVSWAASFHSATEALKLACVVKSMIKLWYSSVGTSPTKERECSRIVEKLEKKAKAAGVDVTSLSNDAKELMEGQQIFAFMTEEYKEDERKRKQKDGQEDNCNHKYVYLGYNIIILKYINRGI